MEEQPSPQHHLTSSLKWTPEKRLTIRYKCGQFSGLKRKKDKEQEEKEKAEAEAEDVDGEPWDEEEQYLEGLFDESWWEDAGDDGEETW